MHPDREVTGTDNQKNIWQTLCYRNGISNEKQFYQSVCPKCGIHHNVYMLWSGRGRPRIFCGQCKAVVARYDDMALSEPTVFSAGQPGKRGKSIERE